MQANVCLQTFWKALEHLHVHNYIIRKLHEHTKLQGINIQ